jgi:hypothetical protein
MYVNTFLKDFHQSKLQVRYLMKQSPDLIDFEMITIKLEA